MTNNLDVEPSVWQECPPGEFRRVLDRMALRDRRKSMVQLASVVVAAVVLVAVGLQAKNAALTQAAESTAGGISCSEVQHFAAANASAPIDARTCDKIAVHLGRCRHCAATAPSQLAELKFKGKAVKQTELGDAKSKSHCD